MDKSNDVTVAIPAGWKLVPIEPTPEMKAAGAKINDQGWDFAHATYSAMLFAAPQADAREGLTDDQRDKIERAEACLRNTGRKEDREAANGLLDVLTDHPVLPELRAAVTDDDKVCADRYRLLRRGQHWSVINGIGDTLRADDLDAAIDAARAGEAS